MSLKNAISYFSSSSANEFDNTVEQRSVQAQIDLSINKLYISIAQLRPIMNALNSSFFKSYYTNPDLALPYVQPYFELYKKLMETLKPIEVAYQNYSFSSSKKSLKYMDLFSTFIGNVLKLLTKTELSEETFLSIYSNFATVLCLFMKNTVNSKINLTKDDLVFLIKQNEMSLFSVFAFRKDMKLKYCSEKLARHFKKIASNPENAKFVESSSLNVSFNSVVNSLNKIPENLAEFDTILGNLNEFRSQLILLNGNMRTSLLISQIEAMIQTGRLILVTQNSMKNLVKYLEEEEIEVSTSFHRIEHLQKFAKNLSQFQSRALSLLRQNKMVPESFFESINEIQSSSLEDTYYSHFLDNIHHHLIPSVTEHMRNLFGESVTSIEFNTKTFENCLHMYIFYLKNTKVAKKDENLLRDLKKNIIISHIFEASLFLTTEKQYQMDSGHDDMEKCINNSVLLIGYLLSFNDLEEKSTNFLIIYNHIMNIFLMAKKKIKDPEQYKLVVQMLGELIPSREVLKNQLNYDAKILKLEKVTNFISGQPLDLLNEYNDNILLKSVNSMKKSYFKSVIIQKKITEDSIGMFVSEIDKSNILLKFLANNEHLIELIGPIPDRAKENAWIDNEYTENQMKVSMSLYSLCNCKGFLFDFSSHFFINWLMYAFSLIRLMPMPIEIGELVPFCDFSELYKNVVFSCNLIEIYSQIIGSSEFSELVEPMRMSALNVFLHLDIDDIRLTEQVQSCVNHSHDISTNFFKKINVLGTNILNNTICFKQLFDFTKNINLAFPKKGYSGAPLAVLNYIECLRKNLHIISDSIHTPRDQWETLNGVLEVLDDVMLTKPRPNLLSKNMEDMIHVMMIRINEARIVLSVTNIPTISQQTNRFISNYVKFFNDNIDVPITPDILRLFVALKNADDDLTKAKSSAFAQISIIRMMIIIERVKDRPPQLIESFDTYSELINVTFVKYVMIDVINMIFMIYDKMSVNDNSEKFFKDDECALDDILPDEEDHKEQTYFRAQIDQSVSRVILEIDELAQLIRKVTEDFPENAEGINKISENILSEVYGKVSMITSCLNDDETVSLTAECNELIAQMRANLYHPIDFAGFESKLDHKALPENDRLVNKLDPVCMDLSRKNNEENELLKEIKILQGDLAEKRQKLSQLRQQQPSELRIRQRSRSDCLISKIKELVGKDNRKSDTGDEEQLLAPPDLLQELQNIRQENEALTESYNKLEMKRPISREDDIDFLMMISKHSYISNFDNNNENDMDREKEVIMRQINETKTFIEQFKKSQTGGKKPIDRDSMSLKLLKELRPKIMTDSFIEEDEAKKIFDDTKELAKKRMSQWRKLRDRYDEMMKNRA